MSENNSVDPKNQNTSSTYETPTGVFEGVPQISYPNTPGFKPDKPVPVGGVILGDTPITYNANRRTVKLTVRNTGDRPVQIGSHFHFFEVNRYVEFDREKAFGYHLNIPATTAIRLEPGDEREVELVAYSGKRYVWGFNDLTNGFAGTEDFPSYYPVRIEAFRRIKEYGFKSVSQSEAQAGYTESEQKKS